MSRSSRPSVGLRSQFRLEVLEDRTVPAGAVMRWHTIALEAVRLDHALGGSAAQFGPTRAARALAIVQSAVYDAVESIDHSYAPYKFQVAAGPGASLDAAVAAAARDTLAALYPTMTITFDAALARELAALPVPEAQAGAAVGHTVAAQVLADRANDGADVDPPYTPGTNPGDWTPDPLHPNQTALSPGWGDVVPFFMTSGSQFRAPPPPALNSPEYTAAYNELLAFGGDGVTTPTLRTIEQTELGIYWGYDGQPGLCSPPRLYNQIAAVIANQQGNTDVQNARYFALVNMAIADAAVASWGTKFFYNLWRPVTAIRGGDTDGNPDTAGIADWTPYGAPADNGSGTNFTPPFPAYVSGHATLGAAAFRTIANYYGTDAISFTFLSDEFNGKTFDMNGEVRAVRPRHFDSLGAATEENAQSRIYLGIHWAFDKTEGISQGNAIADYAYERFLRPIPTPVTDSGPVIAIAAGVGGLPLVRVVDATTGASRFDVYAYDQSFRGGVRVATGDFTGDGVADIVTAAGKGGAGHIKVFDGRTGATLSSFFAFDPAFRGGAYVAAGDIDGDGRLEIVASAGEGGAAHVEVFDIFGNVLQSFFAFDSALRTGCTIALGDVNGDGRADIVVGAGTGDTPHVKVYNGATNALLSDITAFDPAFRGGVAVASADLDSDGRAEVLAGAGVGGAPLARVFEGMTGSMRGEFLAFDASFRGGLSVAIADANRGGARELIVGAGAGGGPFYRVFDGITLAAQTAGTAFDAGFAGGVNVAGTVRSAYTNQNRNAVITWNAVALDAIRTDRTAPPQASRVLAMVQVAVADAVNAVLPLRDFFLSSPGLHPNANATAAAAAAAHTVLASLFPAQLGTFNTALTFSLAGVPDGAAETEGVQLGRLVGAQVLAARANDGSDVIVNYVPGTLPGQWQPTPPAFAPAIAPQWADLTPFAMTDSDQFRSVDGPPELDCDEYAQAYVQVKDLGSATSTTRTADQTQLALFWADGSGSMTPAGHWNQIAQNAAMTAGYSLAETARLFAVLNVALGDAAITSWSAKFDDNFWRPVTAIRAGDTDANDGTIADPVWTPLIVTPPSPATTSVHSTFSGAAATVLTAYFGDNYRFSDSGDRTQPATRTFNSFQAAANEAGMSRIFGGIHFIFDNTTGLSSGRALGEFVVQKYLG